MLENNNILLSNSLFTKRERHQSLDGTNLSTIFENDYSTIQTKLRRSVNTGNFKIIFNTDADTSRKYATGNWVLPTNGGVNNDEFWTYGDLVFDDVPEVENDLGVVNEEVKLKLDFSLLSSFAYFGSLMELIRSSVENIIETFPCSLWIRPVNKNGTVYELSNPFNLDLETTEVDAEPNNLRILSKQYQNYEVVKTIFYNDTLKPCGIVNYKKNRLVDCRYNIIGLTQTYRYIYVKKAGWVGSDVILRTAPDPALDSNNAYYPYIKLLNSVVFNCSKNTDSTECQTSDPATLTITLNYVYNDANGEPCTLLRIESGVSGVVSTGGSQDSLTPTYHIKPKKPFVNAFFLGLNDFQKLLLNTYTNPKYTSTFKIPEEDETGRVYYVNNSFTWATPDGWNIDVLSLEYIDFIDKLTKAAEFLDNFKTDNIYRMLTHDSIKNMDMSFERIKDEAKDVEYLLGASRVNKILRIYGRSYDELKKFIHGIELMNNLSYNEKDNYPDIFLKSNLEYEGWQSLSLVNSSNVKDVSDNLYYGYIEGFSAKELELEFYRRLLLNSPHIVKWKGTKHGLEMIMNLFGIDRNDWEIQEFAYVANASNFCSPNGCNNSTLFQDRVATVSGQIQEGYIYHVMDTGSNGYITYPTTNGVNYYNGDSFTGVDSEPNFTSSATTVSVYMDEIENLAYLNKQRYETMNGIVYFEGELSPEVEEEYDNPDDLHDLCVERFFYGDFETCPICGEYDPATNLGGGVTFINGQKTICTRCNGTGVVRRFCGVPVFKGNSEILYYQQFGEWYQQTYRALNMANTLSELYKLNKSDLTVGDIYFVNNSNIQTDTTRYWVLVDISSSSDMDGWYNVTEVEYNNSINNQIPVDIPTVNPVVQINFYVLENTKDIIDGNNPHSGDYDGGISYLENIGSTITTLTDGALPTVPNNGLFKYVIDNSPVCIQNKPQYLNMIGKGFVINQIMDTKKCWGVYNKVDNKLHIPSTYDSLPTKISDNNCGWSWGNGMNTRKVDYGTNNLEYYRLINTKNIKLTYRTNDDEYKINEFNDVILPYLEDMLPSTAIIELDIS
jgi:hypothetical protein